MLQNFDEYDLEDYRQNNIPYGRRNDNVPGYVYLFKAPEFHGWLPGAWLSRVKIGLSRNPEARADRLESNQPAHDIEILHVIYVADMASVEAELHSKFAGKNVHLNKSREWFDLYPWDIEWCKWLMNRYTVERKGISYKHAAIGLAAVFALGVVITIPTVHFVQGLATETIESEKR